MHKTYIHACLCTFVTHTASISSHTNMHACRQACTHSCIYVSIYLNHTTHNHAHLVYISHTHPHTYTPTHTKLRTRGAAQFPCHTRTRRQRAAENQDQTAPHPKADSPQRPTCCTIPRRKLTKFCRADCWSSWAMVLRACCKAWMAICRFCFIDTRLAAAWPGPAWNPPPPLALPCRSALPRPRSTPRRLPRAPAQ